MRPHDFFGADRIPRRDRQVDLLVRPIGDPVLTRMAQRDRPLLRQPLDHRLVNGREDRIPGDHRQHVVEGDIRLLEVAGGVDRLLVCGERLAQPLDLRRRRVRGSMARQPDLEEPACPLKIPSAVGLRQQKPSGARKGFDHHMGSRPGDLRAFPAADRDEAHLLEREQRLADGGSADTELLHQFALGRQPVARLVDAVMDKGFEAVGDLLVEPAAADGNELHRGNAVDWYDS